MGGGGLGAISHKKEGVSHLAVGREGGDGGGRGH